MKAKLIDENETLRLEYLGVSYSLDYSERFILDILLEKCKEIGAEGIEDLDLETYEKEDFYQLISKSKFKDVYRIIGGSKQRSNYYFIKAFDKEGLPLSNFEESLIYEIYLRKFTI